MAEFDELWKKTTTIFPILNEDLNVSSTTVYPEFEGVILQLTNLGIVESVYESIFIKIDEHLRNVIVPKFWEYFKEGANEPIGTKFRKFQLAVLELNENYKKIEELLNRTSSMKKIGSQAFEKAANKCKDEMKYFNDCFRSSLLAQLPANFNEIVYSFYSFVFKIFANNYQSFISDDEDLDFIDDVKCNGCEKETENCHCQSLIFAFNNTNRYLNEMHLLDRLAGFTLTNLIQERISGHVHDTCQGIFDKSHLKNLENWLESVVFNWLTRIFNGGCIKIADSNKEINSLISDFKIKLSYYLWETYAKIVIEQFFSIIIDFPDSQPAIDDLKICLEKIDLRKHLVKTLKHSLEVRLLHPGVNTMDILTGYVASIKAIRHLDSSGVLVETVTEPVKEYLRRRNDTVRRVVTGLTEEGPTDLAEELARSEALKENIDVSGKDDMLNWENWLPDPVDASPSLSTRKSRSADIISMVVDIYGSKELFVSEYRGLLADRLLTQLDFNPEKEIRNLELLKLRFGETLLHNCEVMLKDISDSKRINTHIQSDINYSNNKAFEISSLILSAQYWPTFNKETLELPDEIQEEFKKYTKSYEAYKGNRTLSWRHVTGRMNIEIELANRTLEMTVTPTQAVIIYHFQNKSTWILEDLSSIMKVPPSVLRKRIIFWQTQGLIKETKTDVYTLIDEAEETSIEEMQTSDMMLLEEDENESAIESASDQREEELQVFWSYIVGMLTNLDSLPIERIHQMLKMFASHGPGVEFSQDELRNFLQRKVREHKLIFAGGVYQLAK